MLRNIPNAESNNEIKVIIKRLKRLQLRVSIPGIISNLILIASLRSDIFVTHNTYESAYGQLLARTFIWVNVYFIMLLAYNDWTQRLCPTKNCIKIKPKMSQDVMSTSTNDVTSTENMTLPHLVKDVSKVDKNSENTVELFLEKN
eukprot:474515_1